MKSQWNNNCILNGSVKFDIYDQNNKLVDSFQNHNAILTAGKDVYKQILTKMLKSNYPYAMTLKDSEQKSLLSNSIDLFGYSGQLNFLQTVKIIDKQNSRLDRRLQKTEYNNGYSATDSNVIITNQNSFWKNSDRRLTNIKMNTTNIHTTAYIYTIGDYASLTSNSSTYHTGIKLDIKGNAHKKHYIRIAYDYSQNSVSNIDVNKLAYQIFPLNNGKPIMTTKYRQFYGLQLMDDQVHSYFFDMYPRYCRIPRRIIFIFQHNKVSDDISIENIQFITHKQEVTGPLAFYICDNSSEQQNYFRTAITKCRIKQNSILYYAKIGYQDANGMNITSAGLCNSDNNIVLETDTPLMLAYNNEQIYNGYNKASYDNQPVFYRARFANPEQCTKLLTQTQFSYEKKKQNRIDILYKININFGENKEYTENNE